MLNRIASFLLGVLISTGLSAQSDSLQNITEATVSAFRFDNSWIKSPSNVEEVDSLLLSQNHGLSPREALNSIPGVRFNERGVDGSRRLAIRGSGLRSPFGVRNVKFYWNGIPITSPDGSTGLEILDRNLVDNVEIIKGPSSSAYGAGMGGVLLATTKFSKNSIDYSSILGSWGTLRSSLVANVSGKKGGIKIGAIVGKADGYREQEFNNKQQYFALGSWKPNSKNTLFVFFNYYNGNWGLPGALTSAQVDDNPRQAVPYSKENNTHVERERIRTGIGHTYQTTGIELSTRLYSNFTKKKNPYGTSPFFNGVKDESGYGLGGRSTFAWKKTLGKLNFKIMPGLEYQYDRNNLMESTLEDGNAVNEKYAVDLISQSVNAFLGVHVNYKGWLFNLGLGYNQLSYSISGLGSISSTKTFVPVLAPRLGLSYVVSRNFSFIMTYSRGYSPPTLWDLEQTNGSLNVELQPELGDNIELGTKFRLSRFAKIQLTGFFIQTQNAIVANQLSQLNFQLRNAGVTEQSGVECSVRIDSLLKRKWDLSVNLAYAFSSYRFKKYVDDGNDFSGNYFPGVPTHMVNGIGQLRFPFNLYVAINSQYISETYINSENTNSLPNYLVVGGKLGYFFRPIKKLTLDAYVSIDNIFNASYSSFIQLNGFGGRFYNPSPSRSFYAGLKVSWQF